MIFVTVGSSSVPFDRLVGAADSLTGEEAVLVQRGCSRLRPLVAESVDYLPMDVLLDHVRRARVVVSHGGVGSALAAALEGHRPVVVPRLEHLGEAVDDHQLLLARRLEALGVVTLVEDVAGLAAAVARTPARRTAPGGTGDLVSDLKAFLGDVVVGRSSADSLPDPV